MVCRLCLQNKSEVLEIFNNKGQELKIAMVIGKHFWFEPKKEDPVSSHICHCCWTKLSDFHEFYTSIETAQQLLTVELMVKTEYNLTVCDISVGDVKLASIHELEENIEEQYEDPLNITSSEFADDLQDQSIEKKKDDQSEVCQKANTFRRALYNHKNHIQQSDGKYVCNICKKSYKMAKSLKEHMLRHTGHTSYRCPHCSRTFNYIGYLERHRKQKHPKEFEEFRKLIKISSHRKEIIIPTISSLSDAAKKTVDLPSEHDIEKNLTSDVLAEENYGVKEFVFSPHLKHQSIDINDENKKDDKDVSAIHDDKEEESDLQFQIKDKKKILRKKGTKPKISSKRNKVESLTKKRTKCKSRGRPRKGNIFAIHDEKENESDLQFQIKDKKKILGKKRHQLKHQRIVETKVQCDSCGSWFKDILNLERHKRLHKYQEHPPVCNICQKTYANIGLLNQHNYKVHILNGKHECNICKKSFKKVSTLKEHMSKHTGPSLYRCPHCSRMFNLMSTLYQHRKCKHPKEFEQLRKRRREDPKIPTIASLSDATKNSGEIDQQYEKLFNITPDVLAEERGEVAPFKNKSNCNESFTEKATTTYNRRGQPRKFQIKDKKKILINEGTKPKRCSKRNKVESLTEETTKCKRRGRPHKGDIFAIYDAKEDESNMQYQINDKNKIFTKNGTKLKRSSVRNRVESLTEKATTTYKRRGRPHKGEVVSFKNKSNCNVGKALKNRPTPEMSEFMNHKISEYMQLKCDVCGIECDTYCHIRKHMRPVHGVSPYVKCCEKKFASRSALYHHIKFHLNPDIYKCEKCDKVFSGILNLSRHKVSMHQSEDTKIFQCPQCPKKFCRKYLLQGHKNSRHSKAYFCSECKRGFSCMSGWKAHNALKHRTKCKGSVDIS